MVSFDVTALFTSINLDLAKETLHEILPENFKSGKLTKFSICKLINLCLITHFEFNGTLYEQLKGTPMGSPISGFIAEIIMQKLEQKVLPTFEHKIWVRYVDDVFTVIKKKELQDVHRKINNVFPDIKFTYEIESGKWTTFLGCNFGT